MNIIKKLLQKLILDQPKYLYRSGWDLGGQNLSIAPYIELVPSSGSATKKTDERIEKRPVEVWEEIISQKPAIDLNSLDKKIAMVRQRKDIIQKMLKKDPTDEIEALGFLEARKKFQKNQQLFQWPTTTFELIDNLLKKYKLKILDLGSTTGHKIIPMEGLLELKKFVEAYEKVRIDVPVLRIILDDSDREDAKEKKKRADPILLAGSPFGKWFYVLGAWDKEIEYIEDLIYKIK